MLSLSKADLGLEPTTLSNRIEIYTLYYVSNLYTKTHIQQGYHEYEVNANGLTCCSVDVWFDPGAADSCY